MRRFHIAPILPHQTSTTLDQEQSHHIRKVLRLKENERIELFDGQGMVHEATIMAVGKCVEARIDSSRSSPSPAPPLHLHVGILKGKKMDLIIQKATELGVHTIHFFTSEFTETKPLGPQKKERWDKISMEACKQCGRNWPLLIEKAVPLPQQLDTLPPAATSLLFWENEHDQDPTALPPLTEVTELHLFIGPEGGFSAAEADLCRQQMQSFSLGPLTLRAETAVITALSLALFLSGRLHPRP